MSREMKIFYLSIKFMGIIKNYNFNLIYFISNIVVILCSGCLKHYDTIERTVNAVWSADNTQILKIVSLYDTYKPSENYYYAPASKNWRYRFETCNPDLSNCKVVGNSPDINQSVILQYVPVYWLPSVQKLATLNPLNKAVLKDLSGLEQLLEPPINVINTIFSPTLGSHDPIDIAPSPNEEIIAVYFQKSYLTSSDYTDVSYCQCVSFFDVKTGSHISTWEVPFIKNNPALNVINQFNNTRCYFLWSKESSGVYIVTRSKSYILKCGSNPGIEQVSLVPERGTKTNSGYISNSGQQLHITIEGNNAILNIVQLDDWKPFNSLELIPSESNSYSYY
jgi:hypothetical protein